MGGGTKEFRRYSISGDSWSAMADTPANVDKGGALTTDGTYIYALEGNTKNVFCGTILGANTWSRLANVPTNVAWGGSLTRLGNYIYAFSGNNKATFYRYDITAGTWSARASAPGNVQDGGALTNDGTYIYALQGKTTGFWRYDPTTNMWSTRSNALAVTNQGAALVFVPGSGSADQTTQLNTLRTLVNGGDLITVTMVLTSSAPLTTTGLVDVSVAAIADDAEEFGPDAVSPNSNGQMYLISTHMEMTQDIEPTSSGTQKIGMRFNGINIPKGATITGAI